MKRINITILTLIILVYAFFVMLYTNYRFQIFCYHAYDLGIYLEALLKTKINHLNPHLTSLNYGFINDHWHPALLLAKIFLWVLSPAKSLFFTETIFSVLTALVPIFFSVRYSLKPKLAFSFFIFILFHKSLLEPILFSPVHPSLWANFFILLGCFFIIFGGAEKKICFWLLILSTFFGEQFVFSALGYSLGMIFLKKTRKEGLKNLFITFLFFIFIFKIRAIVWGPLLNQYQRVQWDIFNLVRLYQFNYQTVKDLVIFFIPISAALYFSQQKIKSIKSELLLISGVLLPPVFGRVLSHSFGQQYSAIFPIVIISYSALFLKNYELTKKQMSIVLIFILILSFGTIKKAVEHYQFNTNLSCIEMPAQTSFLKERNLQVQNIFNFLFKEFKENESILLQGDLAPNFIQQFQKSNVYTFGNQLPMNPNIDWIALERGSCGDPWPVGRDRVEKFIQEIEEQNSYSIIAKTSCLFFAKKTIE